MKKLVLTALAVTLIAGTAAANGNQATVKIGKDKSVHVHAVSPAATSSANSISVNSNVAGGVHNTNKGFYAVNNHKIGPTTATLDVEGAAFHLPKVSGGKGDLSISFADATAVGASISIEKSHVRRIPAVKPVEAGVDHE